MRARTALFAVVPLALLGLVACGGEKDSQDTAKSSPSGVSTTIAVAESDLGSILVDGEGRTLYAFTKDKAGASNCDADCIAVWPALTSTSKVSADQGVTAAMLDESEQAGGAVHVSYGDWPLYYYVGDVAPGDVNGQALDGEWFVLGADGKLIREGA